MKLKYMPALIILYFSIESHSQNIISTSTLLDKIKGGWAGQTIGVTFGGPVEFRYNGTMIQTYHPIPWYKGYVAEMMTHNDGLYDDLYMDLTWVEVLEGISSGMPTRQPGTVY